MVQSIMVVGILSSGSFNCLLKELYYNIDHVNHFLPIMCPFNNFSSHLDAKRSTIHLFLKIYKISYYYYFFFIMWRRENNKKKK
jgi:hypothetical protein